jgi:hypothetical protein
MSLLMPTTNRLFKICAISGTLIILVTVSYAWMRIQQFEQNVVLVFEKMVTENLEAESLKDELQHVDKVLRMARDKSADSIVVDGVEYSSYEIERLRNDSENMMGYMKEKNLALAQSAVTKKHIMNEVRFLFVLSLAFLVVGTLLAAMGYLGWYYRVEMFEERRRQSR